MPFWSNLAAMFRSPPIMPAPECAPFVAPFLPVPPLSGNDRDTIIRTIYGEARGETPAGQAAVVHVVRNRVLARGSSAALECMRPSQFSCWLGGDPNRAKLLALPMSDPEYLRLGAMVDTAWRAPDTVAGARHYFAPSGMDGGRPPFWAKPPGREVARIGGHRFWAGVA